MSETKPVVFNPEAKQEPYQPSESRNDSYRVQSVLKYRKTPEGSSRPVTALVLARDQLPVSQCSQMYYRRLCMIKCMVTFLSVLNYLALGITANYKLLYVNTRKRVTL